MPEIESTRYARLIGEAHSLLAEMQSQLKSNGHKIQNVVEQIVLSKQFREIRGIASAYED